ncbi:hypothetical protein IM543_13915 [Massilia sp. UMI-21]|nr:hypothetical protein IM543_13915 [Massilia sp. UMI-21]
MGLPELSWQFVYARLAWALVLAALVAGAWPAGRRLPRRALAGIAAASLLLMALPGQASPAWHLGLAFQYPSGMLAALCAVKLHARWRAAPAAASGLAGAMPLRLAAVLAAVGSVLYLDAIGLLTLGLYYAGFGPRLTPLLAMLLALACAAAIVRGRSPAQAGAALAAVLLFSLARLPTGNLWDALLDPLLWGWALFALGAAAVRVGLRRGKPGRPAQPQPGQHGQHELPALRAAGAEPFSPIKE